MTPRLEPLHLLVFGAGAVGTYVGGSLSIAGHRVAFLERQGTGERLRIQGIRLRLPGGETLLKTPTVYTSLEAALDTSLPYDAAVFALKGYHTPSAIEMMRSVVDRMPPVVCMQNGIENEAALAGVLGSDNVIPGTVTSAIGRQDIGDIILERLRGIGLSGSHPIIPALLAACNQAGLNARYYPNTAGMKWSKLLTNLTANATAAILQMTPGEIFSHRGLFKLEQAQFLEALNVMKAHGIPVVDLPKTPVRALALVFRSLPSALSRPILQRAIGSGRGNKMPSFFLDLHSGSSQSEVDHLNGAVVRAGNKAGIPTPANHFLTRTLMDLTSKEIPINAYAKQPEKLLASYKSM